MSDAAFNTAFALMDTLAQGRLTLDQVYGFVDELDQPPKHSSVKAVYDEFDADGSGDIDRDEFLGLCQALEKLTKIPVESMSKTFTRKCYLKLFQLVLDDSKTSTGDLEPTVAKKDLRVFVEAASSHLGKGASDTINMLKKFPGDSLNFEAFEEFIGSLIMGKPVSHVLKSFEDSRAKRLEMRKKAYAQFDDGRAPPPPKPKTNASVAVFPGGKSSVFEPPGATGSPSPPPAASPRSASTATGSAAAAECVSEISDPVEREEMIANAFALIDSRGGGVLSLDNVYEFCEALPNPPAQAAVRKLYNEFDEDGSGDIDQDEFMGFCEALEKLVGKSTVFMLQAFSNAMYRRLFDLADDGGDGNGGVSKDELKMLLEAISPMLSSKFTANDILSLLRDYPSELGLGDFTEIVRKLIGKKSISQVVTAFEEAKRRRKAAKHYAMQQFEGVDKKSRGGGSDASPMGAAICFNCVERDDRIKELETLVQQLQAAGGDETVKRQATEALLRR